MDRVQTITNPTTGRRAQYLGQTHRRLIRAGQMPVPFGYVIKDNGHIVKVFDTDFFVDSSGYEFAPRVKRMDLNVPVRKRQSAFNGKYNDYNFELSFTTNDVRTAMNLIRPKVAQLVLKRARKQSVKFGVSLMIAYEVDGQRVELAITAKYATLASPAQFTESYLELIEDTERRMLEVSLKSGAKILAIEAATIHIDDFEPIRGSSWVELPQWIAAKKAVVNVKNKNNQCFKWAVLSAVHPQERNPDRVSHYKPFEDSLDFKGTEFPMKLGRDINRFEDANEMCINVYGVEGENIVPLQLTKKSYERQVSLLLYNNHYCWIKNFNRLLNKSGQGNCYCERCLRCFSCQAVLNRHKLDCIKLNEGVLEEGPKTSVLRFKNHHHKYKHPICIIADFEAITTKVNEKRSNTIRKQRHIAASWALQIVVEDGIELPIPRKYSFTGQGAAEEFVRRLRDICNVVDEYVYNDKPMAMTEADRKHHYTQTKCAFCERSFNKLVCERQRVADHCHWTGKYRCALCRECNLETGKKEQLNKFVPIIFHNLKGYDGHLLMLAFNKEAVKGDNLCAIATNAEKYISFSFKPAGAGCKLRFIDSAAFLQASLDTLMKNLPDEEKTFLKAFAGSDERFELTKKKAPFPYSWFDSFDKLTAEMPPREVYYNDLAEKAISNEDWGVVQDAVNKLGIKRFGEYHDFYLGVDVAGLTDVWQAFRALCLRVYGLDPTYYYTLPGFSWDVALMQKMSDGKRVRLELLQDLEMYGFIERGLRGGMSKIVHRHAEANNKYLHDYDPTRETSYIQYLDANNLYGWAMSQPLPTGGFKWLSCEEIASLEADPQFAGKGLILEVDLDYPAELHDAHNDYPLAPESKEIIEAMLSPYARRVMEKCGLKIVKGNRKLVGTLERKERYVVHAENLAYYLSKGLVLLKIHRGLSFDQEPWLAKFVELNTNLRKGAKNEFEKDLFKLMVNSVFGKTMENVRKRIDFHLVMDEKKMRKLVSKPNYRGRVFFGEDEDAGLVGVHMKKTKVRLDKPIYVGFSVLDLSKLHMFRFHYDVIKPMYGERAKLLFTDTDSLMYHIKTEDIYDDLRPIQNLFDCGEYPKDHPFYDGSNNKVIGKFKDEAKGDDIKMFVGLRAKCYALVKNSNGESKKSKGVKKDVVKNQITCNDYLRTLRMEHENKFTRGFNQLRSYNHQIYTIHQTKVALSPYDDKRHLMDDGITSLAYGHYRIA